MASPEAYRRRQAVQPCRSSIRYGLALMLSGAYHVVQSTHICVLSCRMVRGLLSIKRLCSLVNQGSPAFDLSIAGKCYYGDY